MNAAAMNALRSVARQLLDDLDRQWQAANVKDVSTSSAAGERDAIARATLARYEAKIAPKFSRLQLVWVAGQIKKGE